MLANERNHHPTQELTHEEASCPQTGAPSADFEGETSGGPGEQGWQDHSAADLIESRREHEGLHVRHLAHPEEATADDCELTTQEQADRPARKTTENKGAEWNAQAGNG